MLRTAQAFVPQTTKYRRPALNRSVCAARGAECPVSVQAALLAGIRVRVPSLTQPDPHYGVRVFTDSPASFLLAGVGTFIASFSYMARFRPQGRTLWPQNRPYMQIHGWAGSAIDWVLSPEAAALGLPARRQTTLAHPAFMTWTGRQLQQRPRAARRGG